MTNRRRVRLAATLVALLAAGVGCDGSRGEQGPPVSGTPAEPTIVATDGRGAVSVVAVGDISDCSGNRCPAARTAALAASYQPDVVLALGDLQYPSGALADFAAEYDQTLGRAARRHPAGAGQP